MSRPSSSVAPSRPFFRWTHFPLRLSASWGEAESTSLRAFLAKCRCDRTVPAGSPNRSAISRCFHPSRSCSRTISLCISGSPSSASLSRALQLPRLRHPIGCRRAGTRPHREPAPSLGATLASPDSGPGSARWSSTIPRTAPDSCTPPTSAEPRGTTPVPRPAHPRGVPSPSTRRRTLPAGTAPPERRRRTHRPVAPDGPAHHRPAFPSILMTPE